MQDGQADRRHPQELHECMGCSMVKNIEMPIIPSKAYDRAAKKLFHVFVYLEWKEHVASIEGNNDSEGGFLTPRLDVPRLPQT